MIIWCTKDDFIVITGVYIFFTKIIIYCNHIRYLTSASCDLV